MKKKLFLISMTVLFLSIISISVVKGNGNPWDAVWTAINDIYSRIDALEPQEDYIKYQRFYDPTEHIVETGAIIATYTITPNNPSNNAVLSYYFYFESKGSSGIIDFGISDESGLLFSTARDLRSSGSYRLTNVYRIDYGAYLPKPNSSIYTVRIFALPSGTAHIRNLNIVIEYMDGLPPNN